jgi:hypothetical protein
MCDRTQAQLVSDVYDACSSTDKGENKRSLAVKGLAIIATLKAKSNAAIALIHLPNFILKTPEILVVFILTASWFSTVVGKVGSLSRIKLDLVYDITTV